MSLANSINHFYRKYKKPLTILVLLFFVYKVFNYYYGNIYEGASVMTAARKNATSIVNDIQKAADDAQKKANDAKTTADDLQKKANDAKTTADDMQKKANDAFMEATRLAANK